MKTTRPQLPGRPSRHLSTLLGAAALCALAASPAQATLINYQNFDNLSAFTLNGITQTINSSSQGVIGPSGARVLRLTNDYWSSGSAFLTNAFSLSRWRQTPPSAATSSSNSRARRAAAPTASCSPCRPWPTPRAAQAAASATRV